MRDGVDYEPTSKFYLLGQHFSAIAAAGPIAGPIIACQQWGWLPCIFWLLFGAILIGGVHDFAVLVASLRHKATSIAELVRENVGKTAWIGMMIFTWVSLIYVVIAFADITARTFIGRSEDLPGGAGTLNKGGAVAAASAIYLGLAFLMGVLQRKARTPLWLLTLVFVPATLVAVWAGTRIDTLLNFSGKTWDLVILGYCFVASLLPVWLLLQPRGYLGGFVLYIAIAVGLVGIFGGGFSIQQDAYKGFDFVARSKEGLPTGTFPLFPFLFVTIACGACSGFHSLVSSGTTSKQIAKEPDARLVGYGGMLLETFVALIALSTILIVAKGTGGPGQVYGEGMGKYLCVLIGEDHLAFAKTFGMMVFSTFVFDTIDVATRLGRYILQELMRWQGTAARVVATLATVLPPALILGFSPTEPAPYLRFWNLFGASNQLLAALALLIVAVWLIRSGKRAWHVMVPMFFLLAVALVALFFQAKTALKAGAEDCVVLGTSIALVALSAIIVFESFRAIARSRAKPPAGASPPPAPAAS